MYSAVIFSDRNLLLERLFQTGSIQSGPHLREKTIFGQLTSVANTNQIKIKLFTAIWLLNRNKLEQQGS